jgi:putative tricarboxylic transport membrane protein
MQVTRIQRRTGHVPVRIGYLIITWLFAVGLVAQVFLAGVAVLVNPARWPDHVMFGNILGEVPLPMIVVGLFARLPKRLLVPTILLFPLFIMQYVFVDVSGWARALHPVNALALFWITIYLGQGAWRLLHDTAHDDPPAWPPG